MSSLRAASAGDIARIGELAEGGDLFPAAMAGEMIAPFLGDDSEDYWLVATRNASVDGFLYAAPERLTEGTYNLLAMAVAPDKRANGIGSAMVDGIEAVLSERGARILLVETSSQPQFEPTISFYLARGFKEEARIRDYWAEGDHKLIFRKSLR